MNNDRQQQAGNGTSPNGPPFWEKAIAALGLLLFAAILVYLVHEALNGDDSPPDVSVRVTEIHDSGDDYLVLFEAKNSGGKTAQGVVIRGELTRLGITLESAEATLGYLPSGSTRKGGLFFRNDPREMKLSLTPSGYSRP